MTDLRSITQAFFTTCLLVSTGCSVDDPDANGELSVVAALDGNAWKRGDLPGIDLTLPFPEDRPHNLTQRYRDTPSHSIGRENEFALDFAGGNSPILAAHSGTVYVKTDGGAFNCSAFGINYIDWNGGYGNRVYVYHENGCRTHYAHLSEISVADGESVEQGDPIGIEGRTGCSTGIHLHFAMYCPNDSGGWVPIRPEPLSGFTDFGSINTDDSEHYMVFGNHDRAGFFPDGWHDDGMSQAFRDAYRRERRGVRHEGKRLGWGHDSGGGPFVHGVHGLLVQDFFNPDPESRYGDDGMTLLAYDPYA